MVKPISEFLNNFTCGTTSPSKPWRSEKLLERSIISKENSWKIKLFENWDQIIGSLKGKVSIEKIEGNLIVLLVSHPAWAQELFMFSDVLKQKINYLFDQERIKHIRFRSSRLKKMVVRKKINNTNQFDDNDFDKVCLTDAEQKKLSQVTDPELKDCLEKFCLRCKRGRSEKKRV